MKRVIRVVSIAVLWFGVCALQAGKQSQTASISGIVSDANGQVIPGVSVTVTNTESKSELRTRTTDDPRGKFVVTNLQPGTYKLLVSLLGFKSVEIERTLASGESAQLNITLQIAPNGTGIVDGIGPARN